MRAGLLGCTEHGRTDLVWVDASHGAMGGRERQHVAWAVEQMLGTPYQSLKAELCTELGPRSPQEAQALVQYSESALEPMESFGV